jgi:hypothetical protein
MKHRLLVGILLSLACCGAVFGQEPTTQPAATPAATPGNEFAALQTKNVIADEDRAALRTTILRFVEGIVNQADAAATFVAALREGHKGTPAYKEAYAAICIETIPPLYKSAKPVPAAQLLTILASIGELPAYKTFIDALTDERPAIRTAGAAGLKALRGKIVGGGNALSETIEALKEAGKRETSVVAMRTIYQALNFAEGGRPLPESKALVTATLDILDARGAAFAEKKGRADGADGPGIALAMALRGQASEPEKERLILAVGRIFFHAALAHANRLHALNEKTATSAQIELRNQSELIVEDCEKLLLELIKPTPAPTVVKFMKEGGKSFDMKQELSKWAAILKQRSGQEFPIEETADGG